MRESMNRIRKLWLCIFLEFRFEWRNICIFKSLLLIFVTMIIKKRKMCVTALLIGIQYLLLKRRKDRRWWVRSINSNRRNQGDYHNLIQEMRLQDPEMFFNYTRLNVDQFDLLLSWIGPAIRKHSFREPISPGARLALTLRYLFSRYFVF